jgi:MshEN domain
MTSGAMHVASTTGGEFRRDALRLSFELGRMFVGLRGHQPDRNLFSYLPIDLAMREQLLPIALEGSTLRIATAAANPDLSLVRVRYPQLQLELVSAPAHEIAVALEQVTR